jgi:Ca2+-binding EF-hand superfamily protein
MFSRKRISSLLLSCKTSSVCTFEDIQISSVLITGSEISLQEYNTLPLDSEELLIEYFYNRQSSDLENMFHVFNLLDSDKKGYITPNDLPKYIPQETRVLMVDSLSRNSKVSFKEFKNLTDFKFPK